MQCANYGLKYYFKKKNYQYKIFMTSECDILKYSTSIY